MKILSTLSTLLFTFSLAASAHAGNKCTIQSFDGHYLTAGVGWRFPVSIHESLKKFPSENAGAGGAFDIHQFSDVTHKKTSISIVTRID